jgi:hypothetical protein
MKFSLRLFYMRMSSLVIGSLAVLIIVATMSCAAAEEQTPSLTYGALYYYSPFSIAPVLEAAEFQTAFDAAAEETNEPSTTPCSGSIVSCLGLQMHVSAGRLAIVGLAATHTLVSGREQIDFPAFRKTVYLDCKAGVVVWIDHQRREYQTLHLAQLMRATTRTWPLDMPEAMVSISVASSVLSPAMVDGQSTQVYQTVANVQRKRTGVDVQVYTMTRTRYFSESGWSDLTCPSRASRSLLHLPGDGLIDDYDQVITAAGNAPLSLATVEVSGSQMLPEGLPLLDILTERIRISSHEEVTHTFMTRIGDVHWNVSPAARWFAIPPGYKRT